MALTWTLGMVIVVSDTRIEISRSNQCGRISEYSTWGLGCMSLSANTPSLVRADSKSAIVRLSLTDDSVIIALRNTPPSDKSPLYLLHFGPTKTYP